MQSRLEISVARIEENIRSIRAFLGSATGLIAVVKTNAYGHGLLEFASVLSDCGVREFAVATVEEAVALRGRLGDAEILVLQGCRPGSEPAFVDHGLTATLFDERPLPSEVPVHVKVNTGLNRLGVPWRRAAGLVSARGGQVRGAFSHFAAAETDPELSRLQLERFQQATGGLDLYRHLCNSAGLPLREAHLDAVRPGLALYGMGAGKGGPEVRPVMRWLTSILAITEVAKGEAVGYDGTWVAERPSRVAILPVGYADGFQWRLSNRGRVQIGDQALPVAGRVSMDLSAVDVTDCPPARPGDEVILLSDDPASPVSVENVARHAETIPWDILTAIGPRVERRYLP